jgi:predicted DNA-binding transcriptional regulator YafY
MYLTEPVRYMEKNGSVRASRLVSILLLLQTRGRMTAPELATELEVSVRTVYRDLDALGAAGIPVYADRGPAGGYQLVDGYRTRLTGLTGDEAESLFLVGVPDAAAQLGLGTVLAAAELKLQAALPPELRSRATRLRERFHLDAPGWFRSAELDPTPHLAAIADAVWHQRVVQVDYRNWAGADAARRLEPFGVVLKAGVWYVVARDGERIGSYRASRILTLDATDDRFERPDDFDLSTFWSERTEELEAAMYRAEATVRLSGAGFERMQHQWSARAQRGARDTASEPDADGWRIATVPIESFAHARSEMGKLGADVEVIGPPELRSLMVETAAALARIYDR